MTTTQIPHHAAARIIKEYEANGFDPAITLACYMLGNTEQVQSAAEDLIFDSIGEAK